jgi:hypothetical protein
MRGNDLSGEGMGNMNRHRALAALVLASMLAILQPTSVAAAPPPDRVQAVHLTGICPWAEGESKDVSTVLLGNRLMTPYFLFDARGTWTRAVLMPNTVTASGEGLKARHLLPGVYTRPGPAPAQPVTCEFVGTTPDGDVNLQVEGTVKQMPRSSRPR